MVTQPCQQPSTNTITLRNFSGNTYCMYQILNPKLCGKDRAVNLQVKQLSKSAMIAKQMQMVNKADL